MTQSTWDRKEITVIKVSDDRFVLERDDFENDTTPHNIDKSQARCPYCGKEENDSWEIDSDTDHECGHCGEIFWVETEVVRNFTTYKLKEG
jgi:predicted RNA-binding Zn-ribbon protein involved in translation (DUF1610 family)